MVGPGDTLSSFQWSGTCKQSYLIKNSLYEAKMTTILLHVCMRATKHVGRTCFSGIGPPGQGPKTGVDQKDLAVNNHSLASVPASSLQVCLSCVPKEPSVGLRCPLLAFRGHPHPHRDLAYVVMARPTLPVSVSLNVSVGCRVLPPLLFSKLKFLWRVAKD